MIKIELLKKLKIQVIPKFSFLNVHNLKTLIVLTFANIISAFDERYRLLLFKRAYLLKSCKSELSINV